MIPIMIPWMGEEEVRAVQRVILSNWVTQGPEVEAFEKEFAAFVGAPHACAVSSCTTALHLALAAAGVGPGDRVLTVSHSFIATANAVRYLDAVPVFVDVDPINGNVDPDAVARAMNPAIKAILAVHQIGMPCDLVQLSRIAEAHGVPLIEDAACAIGSEIRIGERWELIGKPHGRIACFSFHPRKLVTTGDGGMLTTADPALDKRFRLLRQHAMTVSDRVRHSGRRVVNESYSELGYNYRMTDIQAAVGRVQLQRVPEMIARRRALADRYLGLLSKVPGVGLPAAPAWAKSNWQSFQIRLPRGQDQVAVMQHMLDSGVATRRGIMNSHREPAYAEEPWDCANGRDRCDCKPATCRYLKNGEQIQDHHLILPLFHAMTHEQQDSVVDALIRALQRQPMDASVADR